MPVTLSRTFFAAVCLAIVAGGWQSGLQLPWRFVPPDPNPGWAARYEALVPLVAGSPRAFLVQEDPEGGVHHLFRAQFVLSPAVIEERPTLDKIQIWQLKERPLILDYRTGPQLRAALRELRLRAEEKGFELTAETVGQTAVVRAHRAKKR